MPYKIDESDRVYPTIVRCKPDDREKVGTFREAKKRLIDDIDEQIKFLKILREKIRNLKAKDMDHEGS